VPLTKGKVINVFCYFVPHASRTLSQIISPLQLSLFVLSVCVCVSLDHQFSDFVVNWIVKSGLFTAYNYGNIKPAVTRSRNFMESGGRCV